MLCLESGVDLTEKRGRDTGINGFWSRHVGETSPRTISAPARMTSLPSDCKDDLASLGPRKDDLASLGPRKDDLASLGPRSDEHSLVGALTLSLSDLILYFSD